MYAIRSYYAEESIQVVRVHGGERHHPRHLLGEEPEDPLARRADIADAAVGVIENDDVAAVFGDQSEPCLALV